MSTISILKDRLARILVMKDRFSRISILNLFFNYPVGCIVSDCIRLYSLYTPVSACICLYLLYPCICLYPLYPCICLYLLYPCICLYPLYPLIYNDPCSLPKHYYRKGREVFRTIIKFSSGRGGMFIIILKFFYHC